MDILNFGDCIKNGNYKLHSKFKRAHNYIQDREIVSLVSSEIGRGPNNIVLNRFPQRAEHTMVISSHTVSIGNTALHIAFVEPQQKEDIYINNISDLLSGIEICYLS